MSFDKARWWEIWHPNKAPGVGRPKATGGKAGTGKAASRPANVDNKKRKKS
jgi:hypothetical protein